MKEFVDLNKEVEKLTPKGRVKVELFDESGNVVEERETDNFISKGVKELYKLELANIFRRNKVSGGTTRPATGDLFGRMYLTDANHPEDPSNEWYMKGLVVGFAFTNTIYAGDSGLQGTYNEKESYTNTERTHIVIDFPTHAGNGTINSVYFTSDGRTWGDYNAYKRLSGDLLYTRDVVEYNGYYYQLNTLSTTSGRTQQIFEYDKDFNKVRTIRLQVPLGNVTYSGLAIVNNKLYFTSGISNAYIYKVNMDDISSDVITASIVNDTIQQRERQGIVYCEERKRFYTIDKDGYIEVFNHNFELLSRFRYTPGEWSINRVGVSEVERLLGIDGNTLIAKYGTIDMDTEIPTKYNQTGTNGVRIEGFYKGLMYDGYGRLMPKSTFSSRALLDAPVTKTSTNTMKVSYTFEYPSIYD